MQISPSPVGNVIHFTKKYTNIPFKYYSVSYSEGTNRNLFAVP